jgi:tripartite-type tricarboxylate transporter receptor subunit TctC
MQRRTVLGLLACAIVFCAALPAATAQDLSDKPIHLLVGLAAGGATT